MRRIHVGETIAITSDSARTNKKVTGKILSKKDRTFEIELSSGEDSLSEALHEIGIMPIPPYIRQGQGDSQDVEDYQTLFAREPGSVAAPTASLHFTEELLQEVRSLCPVLTLTLHVGQASFTQVFRPGEQEIALPGQERFSCPEQTRLEIEEGKKKGNRVIAIGTTCTRALETLSTTSDLSGETSLFIQPGYRFNAVDSLVTNFHQPGTTHLLLVEAMMGRELLEASYQYALSHGFRFLSYGDAMLIL